MKGKTKKSILFLVLVLAIGFAAVTTTLTINGTIRLGANQENFKDNLIFTKAELTYSDDVSTTVEEGENATISGDGKSISFTTRTLKNIGSVATLTYDITNNSQYTAEFTGITCAVTNNDGTDVTDAVKANTEYITLDAKDFTTETGNIKIKPTEKVEGHTLNVAMRKSFVGDETTNTTQYTITCTINASGLSE